MVRCKNPYCRALYKRGTDERWWGAYRKAEPGDTSGKRGAFMQRIPHDECPICGTKEAA